MELLFTSIFGEENDGVYSLIQSVVLIAVVLFYQEIGRLLLCTRTWRKALRRTEKVRSSTPSSSPSCLSRNNVSFDDVCPLPSEFITFNDHDDSGEDDDDENGPFPPLTASTRRENTSMRVMVDEVEFEERHPSVVLGRVSVPLVEEEGSEDDEEEELTLSDRMVHDETTAGTTQEPNGSKHNSSCVSLRKQQSYDTVGLTTDADEDDKESSIKLDDWNNSFHSTSSSGSSSSSVKVKFVNDFAVAACAANVSRNLRKKVLKREPHSYSNECLSRTSAATFTNGSNAHLPIRGAHRDSYLLKSNIGKDLLSLNSSSVQATARSASTGSASLHKQKTGSRSIGGANLTSLAPPPIPKGRQLRSSCMGGANLVSTMHPPHGTSRHVRSSSTGGSNLVASASSAACTTVQSPSYQDRQILEQLSQSAPSLNY